MQSLAIVTLFQKCSDPSAGIIDISVRPSIGLIALQGPHEAFGHRIVPRTRGAAHAWLDSGLFQAGNIVAAGILHRVMDQSARQHHALIQRHLPAAFQATGVAPHRATPFPPAAAPLRGGLPVPVEPCPADPGQPATPLDSAPDRLAVASSRGSPRRRRLARPAGRLAALPDMPQGCERCLRVGQRPSGGWRFNGRRWPCAGTADRVKCVRAAVLVGAPPFVQHFPADSQFLSKALDRGRSIHARDRTQLEVPVPSTPAFRHICSP